MTSITYYGVGTMIAYFSFWFTLLAVIWFWPEKGDDDVAGK